MIELTVDELGRVYTLEGEEVDATSFMHPRFIIYALLGGEGEKEEAIKSAVGGLNHSRMVDRLTEQGIVPPYNQKTVDVALEDFEEIEPDAYALGPTKVLGYHGKLQVIQFYRLLEENLD